jgi:monoamine oxidase
MVQQMTNSGSGQKRKEIDIAVVGAGVAGTYCCWRLKTGQSAEGRPRREPILFEMSDRIGGRLFSVNVPDIPSIKGELGGMRFLETQRMVCSIAKHLNLGVSDFPMGGLLNISTLRGVRLRAACFTEYPELVPYRLLPGERGLAPGDLLVKAIKTVIPCATTLSPEQWEPIKQTSRWNGDHLYNWGLWNVLLSTNHNAPGNPPVLSSEAYALLYEGGGYESLVDNWNCAEAFQYLLADFPREAKYKRLLPGFQTLPETLAQKFEAAGGKIKKNHRLLSFVHKQADDDIVIDLDVRNEETSETCCYTAKALILAMPQRSLQMLECQTEILQKKEVQELLKAVMPMPAYKALVGYPTPWWKEKLGITAGRSTTDLPIRQVYYMDSAPSPDTQSLMLASYNDGRTDSFWSPLWERGKAEKKYPLRASAIGRPVRRLLPQEQAELAPKDFVETLHTLTSAMHQLALDEIPEPYFARVKDWTDDPFGAGWHFWRAGIKVWDVLPKVRQPIAGIPIYICGEAYTNQQGWVEGALISAEHVVRKYGLNPPDWLEPQNYYLGP